MRRTSSRASSSVRCAVCPSCQRNSVVRRNRRVRISQRTTFAHWLMRIGRSRQDWTHFPYMVMMIASDVGRIASRSSSSSLPAAVIQATSGLKPATCSASRWSRLSSAVTHRLPGLCRDCTCALRPSEKWHSYNQFMDQTPPLPCWLEVDLDAISANVRALQRWVRAGTALAAVVKAQGYGTGASEVAREAVRAGADWVAVARVHEG